MPENQRFFDFFRGYGNGTLVWNGYFNCGSDYKNFINLLIDTFLAAIGLFNITSGNTITMCEIPSKLTRKTSERNQVCRLMSLLLTLNEYHTMFWCFYCWQWTRMCRLGCYTFIMIYNIATLYQHYKQEVRIWKISWILSFQRVNPCELLFNIKNGVLTLPTYLCI